MAGYEKYVGSVHYSDEDEVFHGKLVGIRDLVSDEGPDVRSLRQAFQDAVKDSLATGSSHGKNPEVPFKGLFNVQVGPELHKRAASVAAEPNLTLNALVGAALERYLEAPHEDGSASRALPSRRLRP